VFTVAITLVLSVLARRATQGAGAN